MKKNNKIFIAIATTVVYAISMSAESVKAANARDTIITNFTVPPSASGTYAQLPDIRFKETNSSVYLNVTSATYNVSVQTWGLTSASWYSRGRNCTCNAYGSATNAVTVAPGHRYQIQNIIKESGFNYAGLKFCSTNQYNSATISCRWDSDYTSGSGEIIAD